jgi:hypothetical protein
MDLEYGYGLHIEHGHMLNTYRNSLSTIYQKFWF